MMFEWFDEHEFHFKEHDDWTIQSRDQATSSFKDHIYAFQWVKLGILSWGAELLC